MQLSISITLLLGVTVLFLVRKDELKISHAIVVALLGFFLSTTAAAGGINGLGAMIATMLGGAIVHTAGH